ncbi:MAG: TRAP transporter large permease subunit, partial [Beijerinckiaceae bacterium]
MSGAAIALIGFGVMLVLIALRAPIGLAMLLVGAAGFSWLSSPAALFAYMKTNSYHQFANYTLSVIPLFILMGALAERAGIAAALFKAAERALGGFRGGLAMAVIGACTAFGAICGSSVATTATFGRAALPELLRARYDGGLATGVIAVGGTLGILIPPSVILVVYAITTEQNIAKLFQAALIPGLLAALFYCLTIAILVRRNPTLAPPTAALVIEKPKQPLWPKLLAGALLAAAAYLFLSGRIGWMPAGGMAGAALLIALIEVAVMPAILVAIIVVGGIYGGVFTPTEGAAVGAIA